MSDLDELLENRWVQLGLAIAAGYLVGRLRKPFKLGPFATTVATTAMTALVRTGLQAAREHQTPAVANRN